MLLDEGCGLEVEKATFIFNLQVIIVNINLNNISLFLLFRVILVFRSILWHHLWLLK